MSVTTETSGAPGDARDAYQATLDRLNAEQGFTPAADETQPEPADATAPEGLTATPAPATTAPAPEAVDQTPAPLPEVGDELTRLRNQYQANLEQNRKHYEAQLAQQTAAIKAQQQAEAEAAQAKREQDQAAARATDRAEVDRRLRLPQIANDPQLVQQLVDYRAQLDSADRAYYEGQLAREQARANGAVQQAQGVIMQAQTQQVVAMMPQLLAGYAPNIAATLAAQGLAATPEEVQAIVARPEYVAQAQEAVHGGKEAVNLFGNVLTTAVANELRLSRQYQTQAAAQRRAEVDASGVARAGQAGNAAGAPLPDPSQFKSTPTKKGDMDAMLRAINARQGIAVAGGRRQ